MLIECFFVYPGAQRLPSRQVQEWTTPSDKRFSVSVSPYIACVEAERSEEEEKKRHHTENTNANNTPRARPGRVKSAKREAPGIGKASKIGKKKRFPSQPLFGSSRNALWGEALRDLFIIFWIPVYFAVKLLLGSSRNASFGPKTGGNEIIRFYDESIVRADSACILVKGLFHHFPRQFNSCLSFQQM